DGHLLYPVASRGFVPPDGYVLQAAGPGLRALRDNFRRLVDSRIYDHSSPASAWLQMTSGWGPLVFALGIPAIPVLAAGDVRWRRLTAGFLVSLSCVFLLVRSDPWFVRFVLFFPAMAGLAAAKMSEEVRATKWIVGVCLLAQLAG